MKRLIRIGRFLLCAALLGLCAATATLAAPAAPGSIAVPVNDADGSYTVVWSASPSGGVTYTLQEATDAAFTANRRLIAAGTALKAAIAGRTPMQTYYYRVRAIQAGVASPWRVAANGCAVGRPAAPASLTVPGNDADGKFTVAWSASPTAGVTTYVVHEATDRAFSANLREVHRGPGSSVTITLPATPLKTYYYRVRAIRPGYLASLWRGPAVCRVGRPASVATLTVPAADGDGDYFVSWSASTTAGVSYTLQEATNATFTANLRTVFKGTTRQATIVDRAAGNYHYRVRAERSGFVPSLWQTAPPCAVAVAPPDPLNDTGVVQWANGASSTLTSPQGSYPDQDADLGRDARARTGALPKTGAGKAGFDFTKLDPSGNPLAATATSWSCVRDNATGLTWEAKTDDGGLRDKDNTYSWYNVDPTTNGGHEGYRRGTCSGGISCDTSAYVAAVNTLQLCGATDWRLPTTGELQQLVDFSTPAPGPKVDTAYFPRTGAEDYATSVPSSTTPAQFCTVDFSSGRVGCSAAKFDGHPVRLVRGD